MNNCRAWSPSFSYYLYLCGPNPTPFPPCICLQTTTIIFSILGSSRSFTTDCDAPHSQSSSPNVEVDNLGAKELLSVTTLPILWSIYGMTGRRNCICPSYVVKYHFSLHKVEDLCSKTNESVLILVLWTSLLYYQYVFYPFSWLFWTILWCMSTIFTKVPQVLPFMSSLSLLILIAWLECLVYPWHPEFVEQTDH